jgi:hypothetical protein
LSAAREADAVELAGDAMGLRWRADISIRRHERHAVIRTVWMMRTGEDALRFVTCWVL